MTAAEDCEQSEYIQKSHLSGQAATVFKVHSGTIIDWIK